MLFYIAGFLGGLSLHLNHLIGSRVRISYRSFGTLPIGISFSNLGSGQLMTCPRTLFCQIWNMSLFGDSRAVRVLMPKYRPFRKSIFSRWRSGASFSRLWGCRWADGWPIWWYHFWGGARHLGALAALRIQRFRILVVFRHICGSLEGTRHWAISSSISAEVQSRVP